MRVGLFAIFIYTLINALLRFKYLFGWKGRIGILVPSGNSALESEFNMMKPEGISVHAAILYCKERPPQERELELLEMAEKTEDAVKRLMPVISIAKAGVICYGCTSGSFILGLEHDRELVGRIEAVSGGIPAVTTTDAVLSAFNELDIKRISVVSPYPEVVNKRLLVTLEDSGFEIVTMENTDYPRAEGLPLEVSYNLAKKAYRPETDGIFISCTSLRAVENIERLEKETGKPVVTSNQASMWACLKALGYKETVEGYGRLLTMNR